MELLRLLPTPTFPGILEQIGANPTFPMERGKIGDYKIWEREWFGNSQIPENFKAPSDSNNSMDSMDSRPFQGAEHANPSFSRKILEKRSQKKISGMGAGEGVGNCGSHSQNPSGGGAAIPLQFPRILRGSGIPGFSQKKKKPGKGDPISFSRAAAPGFPWDQKLGIETIPIPCFSFIPRFFFPLIPGFSLNP